MSRSGLEAEFTWVYKIQWILKWHVTFQTEHLPTSFYGSDQQAMAFMKHKSLLEEDL